RSGRVAWAVMRWVACSISASTAESEAICQGQDGQSRITGMVSRRPIRSISYIRFSISDGCTEPARGRSPGGLVSCVGVSELPALAQLPKGLLLLGVLVVLLGSAEGLVVDLLAVDHGVLERVRSAVVHDSA